MKLLKTSLATLASLAMVMSMAVTPTKADTVSYDATAQLYATVTDAGEVVDKLTLDYGIYNPTASDIDVDTFTVHAVASTEEFRDGTDVTSYGDYEIDRTIEKVEVKKNVVTLYFAQNEGATLAYLSSGRNYPADLTYTVTQNESIMMQSQDLRDLGEFDTTDVTVDTSNIIDEETAKFTAVDDDIDYQLYVPEGATSLIVWYHGNGEGDINGTTGNNVAQMLANRGTVAWATDEAQAVFGKTAVMAFQAPDMWYLAKSKGYLETTYNEIQDVVSTYGIDPDKLAVSGCSAGGYMSTEMIINYPDLFAAAMINCPALDVANSRSGTDDACPTDDELAGLKDSRTAIWLVQGETDSSVNPDDCSKRIWSFLSDGEEVTENSYEGTDGIASGFTTYETADNKYKLSLYETTDAAKLKFSEDYDLDGEQEEVLYSNHWSWIYTLRNNPEAADGSHIWQWAADQLEAAKVQLTGKAQLSAEVTDAGENINKVEITLDGKVDADSVTEDTFKVHAYGTSEKYTALVDGASSYGDYDADRTVVDVDVVNNEDGTSTVTLTLLEGETGAATLAYLSTGRNVPLDITYTITTNNKFTSDGDKAAATITCDNTVVDDETSKFTAVDDDIDYQLYVPEGATSLIVWYHGNGEGDMDALTSNNVAQMLANRGTVAWATDEAQAVFGKTAVMAFQAPDMWYLAKKNGYLETTYNEIMDVVNTYGIDPDKLAVSGCSAGGYMSTEMIINYPDLFAAAMINCPALDVANSRSGTDDACPTDDELAGLKDSKTAIWLVQGETDASVNPEYCSKRIWSFLSDGEEVTSQYYRGTDGLASGFTTYETADGKYKLSLYDTTDAAKLKFSEDYNADGTSEQVLYSNHWSWIYTLRNNPEAADGTHIWQWASKIMNPGVPAPTTAAKITTVEDHQSGVYVKWSKVATATGYKVYRDGELIATVGNTSAYKDYTAKTNGKKYTYTVVAFNEGGDAPASAAKSTVVVKAVKITSAKNVKGKKVTVKYSKNSKATGYQIKYVTGKTTKYVTVKGAKNVSKTISKLSKKSYKVYVRAYKTVSGKKYYSAYSKAKSVKVTK